MSVSFLSGLFSGFVGPSSVVVPPTPRQVAPARMAIADGTVNVGVIGAGRIGIVHLEALSGCASANPIIISNPTVSKAQAAAAQYKVPEFSGDAMDVINHPDVEAVWICSPSQFHAEQIKACAANGKHIFCEKPIATDVPETIEAINFCNEKGVKLMTALQRRFDPNFARVKQACSPPRRSACHHLAFTPSSQPPSSGHTPMLKPPSSRATRHGPSHRAARHLVVAARDRTSTHPPAASLGRRRSPPRRSASRL